MAIQQETFEQLLQLTEDQIVKRLIDSARTTGTDGIRREALARLKAGTVDAEEGHKFKRALRRVSDHFSNEWFERKRPRSPYHLGIFFSYLGFGRGTFFITSSVPGRP